MNMRSSRSIVTFSHAFLLPGYPEEMPAGEYEVLAEDELLQGLSFQAYRRVATYLTVRGRGGHAGRVELLQITENDLEVAQGRALNAAEHTNTSEAALSPRKEKL